MRSANTLAKASMPGASVETPHNNNLVDVIWLEEFPPCSFNTGISSTLQIVTYLRRMLESRQNEQARALVIPSVIELSGFFHRSELDILDAFSELKSQGYEHRIPGLDGLITIWDPLARRKPARHSFWRHLFGVMRDGLEPASQSRDLPSPV